MSNQEKTNLTVEQALKLLREYSCIQAKTIDAVVEKDQLREALLLIASITDYENIGVCADNAKEGWAALSSYLQALGHNIDVEAVAGNSFPTPANFNEQQPVYIKYNTQKQAHYLDSYTGSYRGVLISCQAEDDALVGTYGHFPLDLFM